MSAEDTKVKEDYQVELNRNIELYLQIGKAARALERLAERELSPLFITPQEAELLWWVASSNEHMTIADLSRQMARMPHSISGLADRMEKRGLVYRAKDLEKANLVRICLTESGWKVAGALSELEILNEVIRNTWDMEIREGLSRTLGWLATDCTVALSSLPKDWKERV